MALVLANRAYPPSAPLVTAARAGAQPPPPTADCRGLDRLVRVPLLLEVLEGHASRSRSRPTSRERAAYAELLADAPLRLAALEAHRALPTRTPAPDLEALATEPAQARVPALRPGRLQGRRGLL